MKSPILLAVSYLNETSTSSGGMRFWARLQRGEDARGHRGANCLKPSTKPFWWMIIRVTTVATVEMQFGLARAAQYRNWQIAAASEDIRVYTGGGVTGRNDSSRSTIFAATGDGYGRMVAYGVLITLIGCILGRGAAWRHAVQQYSLNCALTLSNIPDGAHLSEYHTDTRAYSKKC